MIDVKKFIEVWQTSGSVQEVMDKTGMTYNGAYQRAKYLRRNAVPLKKFTNSKHHQYAALAEYAKSFEAKQAGEEQP